MADQTVSAKYVARDFFVYNAVFANLAAGASATYNLSINADSDFQVEKLTYMADLSAAAETASGLVIPLVTVQIQDSGSGRYLMDQATPVPNLFGTGQIPFVLKQPKIFVARANIVVTVANYSAVTAYNLRLSFIGSKLFLR